MEEHNLDSWEQLEGKLSELEQRLNKAKSESALGISNFLYIGQANSQWELETTLDRFFKKRVSLREYYRLILTIKSKIETFTDKNWNIPNLDGYEKWIEEETPSFIKFEAYAYFAYLRHHGFPSPLLDWSASPYIAAFFAFNNLGETPEYVSVYIFWE
jgi:hypothetical protein